MQTRRQLVGSIMAAGFLATPMSHALAAPATPAATPAADLTSALDAMLSDQMVDIPFTGAALIEQRGALLLRAGYGDAEMLAHRPNTPETGYQIASITKTFTASLVMLLRDDGKLSLDDPAAKYLPDYPHLERDGVPVTIRHLLSHTSGVPDFLALFDVTDFGAYPDTVDELVKQIAEAPLDFTPGSEYRYSNSGYLYLGQIVRAVTGVTWEQALTSRILEPLTLKESWLRPPRNPGEQATGYTYIEGFLAPISRLGRRDLAEAAGGLTSTLDDLHTWFAALRGGQVVKPETYREMSTIGAHNYGLGLEQANLGGEAAIGHYGQTIGYRSAMFFLPAHDTTLILLANRQDLAIEEVADRLATVITSD